MRVWFAGGGTGGHLYPGLAIARALVTLRPDAEPLFIGAQRGVERDVLPGTGFAFRLLDLHPLYRARPWRSWRTVAGLTGAWRALGELMRADRPALVIGTGGYASGAALARAVRERVPLVLQEQNSYPGMTTRAFARWAREIYLGYGEAAARLRVRPPAWLGETGNPIAPPPEPKPARAAARREWGFPETQGSVVLAFGGSQGARGLNDALAGWVERGLPDTVHLIWATGRGAHERYAHLDAPRVRVVPYLSPIERAYAATDLAVTRSGALTLAELCAWGIPSILVPLPTSAAGHQDANARVLADDGAAVYIAQADLSPLRLDAEVRRLTGDAGLLAGIAAKAAARGRPRAAQEIAGRIAHLLAQA
ncbi:MAG TPA: UDP-N-acetylglucosamine--N-acetylmuramyl-(pentapeptide) pyrophosphoryl-undecaprenol N-acetylglucosamine transferase [Gemmatimonadaceae bacterium]|nr:UDP-N-acetylglucosamine--N-acetylmuramyl-(pentapeptide) pyrophosphoryl-undecaprenol N-acetylglucosamine transferase [Gemmatimonadaceae bacterium]